MNQIGNALRSAEKAISLKTKAESAIKLPSVRVWVYGVCVYVCVCAA